MNWDINCDAAGDFGDALLILQKEVGLRVCTDAVFCVNVCNPVCEQPSAPESFFLQRMAAGDASVRAEAALVPLLPGRLFTLPVYVDPAGQALGGYVMELVFDPAIFRVEDITGGGSPEFSEKPVSDEAAYGTGGIRFAGINLRSLHARGESLHVADVTFRILTSPGREGTAITLRPLSLKDTEGLPMGSKGSHAIKLAGEGDVLLRDRSSGGRERGNKRNTRSEGSGARDRR
jgi:hypothetical protein